MSGIPPASPGWEDSRAFLQRRVASYGLFGGGIGVLFLLIRAAGQIAQGDWGHLVSPNMLLHAVGVVPLLVVWALLSRGERSQSLVHQLDLTGILFAGAGYGAMAMEISQPHRPDLTLLQILAILSLTRAIYVPSSLQRTLALSLALGVELALVTWVAFDPLDPGLAASFEDEAVDFGGGLRAQLLGNVLMWWVGFTAVACGASAVIYGLRRDLRRVRKLGQYTLLHKIGEGGMGVVYRAQHALLRRPTAVKLLRPDKVGAERLERFEREVQAASELDHPNTVTVFDYGRTADGLFYYAMEFVDGGSLADVVQRFGALPAPRVVFLLEQIAAALGAAHDAGLIHRDIKPDNVLLGQSAWQSDHAKLVDFGLVKDLRGSSVELTGTNQIMGTPRYMAPETVRDGTSNARSDLYALGCVAWYLLAGRHPFDGQSIVEVAAKHLTEAPPSLSRDAGVEISSTLEAIVDRCMEKDPSARPASARELLDALAASPEHGRWTADDAARWWRSFGSVLRENVEPDEIGTAETRELLPQVGSRAHATPS